MKKNAMKTSGIITLIFSIILLLISLSCLFCILDIKSVSDIILNNDILSKIEILGIYIFIEPLIIVFDMIKIVDTSSIQKIISIIFVLFSLYMIFWGIKEIKISKRDDVNFAKCKKTCGFMFFTKFMVFLYFVVLIAGTFFIKEIKNISNDMGSSFGFDYGFVVVVGIFATLSLILFVLPVSNVNNVAKNIDDPNYQGEQQNIVYDENGQQIVQNDFQNNMQNNQNFAQQSLQNFQQYNQNTMQANMPPMQGYNPQQNNKTFNNQIGQQSTNLQNQQQIFSNQQSQNFNAQQGQNINVFPSNPQSNINNQNTNMGNFINPNANINNVNMQNQNNNMANVNNNINTSNQQSSGNIIPGQNDVPVNISPKGIAELERLERLKSLGTLSPEAYMSMKQKICSNNLQ